MPDMPVYAYGSHRGSALGGAARSVNLFGDKGPEVATLFDEGASLVHAETWLIGLESCPEAFRAVRHALCTLLDVGGIDVMDRRVWVKIRNGPDVLLPALGAGRLALMGWFVDLVARWLVSPHTSTCDIDADFMQRMTGLVLIDEIDAHMHPQKQTTLISTIRELLPRMSFVVTTNSLVTLTSVPASEVWVLSLGEDGHILTWTPRRLPSTTCETAYERYFGVVPEQLSLRKATRE